MADMFRALKESEEKYRLLVDNSLQGIIIATGPSPNIIYANPAISKMLGYSVRKLTSLKPKQVMELVHPEDRKDFFRQFRNRLSGKKAAPNYTFRGIRKDGDIRWFEVSAGRFIYRGKPALQATFIDITERKEAEDALRESEEKFRSMIEASHDLIMLTNIDGTVAYLSPTCDKVLGWDPEKIVGTRPSIFHPEDSAKVEAALGRALQGESGENLQYRVITQDGKVRWVSHSWSPLKLYGKLRMVASVVQDITERKKNMENLIRQKEQIEELSMVKERLMADITHELKTPLSVIMLNLDMARKMDPVKQRDALQDCFNLMWRNSMRLSRSVDQIMQLTRMASADVSTARFSIPNMMFGICSEYTPLAEAKGIEFTVGGPEIEINSNQHLLTMAVSNLVSNAIKFTHTGKVSIRWMKSGGYLIINISDTGIGIKSESKAKVFYKFFKEDHDAPGSGIGLAISADIVRRLGGRMEFDSVPKKGSTFRIIIPMKVKP